MYCDNDCDIVACYGCHFPVETLICFNLYASSRHRGVGLRLLVRLEKSILDRGSPLVFVV